ncbi:MAG TPA: GIY-YIG nuclease family protein, partial [Thiobacillus sp.]
RCADGSLYTGVTTDVARRVAEHNGDGSLGARYTRPRRGATASGWSTADWSIRCRCRCAARWEPIS